MIDQRLTTSTNLDSGTIPVVKRRLRNLKAILSGTAATAVKPAKKAYKAQLEP